MLVIPAKEWPGSSPKDGMKSHRTPACAGMTAAAEMTDKKN
ncbi:MAG: hypothetical protein ACRD4E_15490 [Bryobacteraceae bacterium]